ncbi:unnamed protein product [Didymodactylos carnosus]|uniref:DUF4371 domain-containing protein n=1 Tax=Didymodactylos carnosus TaxID=1234261 RepID=A0A8S2CTC5_9BILA|nr:unnamed protein product [Didymodactylos carnosus]CAF3509740.1 unnamed protein product [Didymodactylos carnosus]
MPIEESVSLTNEGNFRALLQYRISGGDSVLQKHLETAPKNATYISKTTQNIIISCINDLISQQIIAQVKEARFFTVMLDETADIANVEQASICVRYVYNNMINERFLKFAAVIDRTRLGLATLLLQEISSLGLDMNNCVGQGYDGCSAMSGRELE